MLDAENPNDTGEIFLRKCRKIMNLKNTNTPVVAICNYVIDSLVTVSEMEENLLFLISHWLM